MEFDLKGVFSFRSDGESRKNEFSRQMDDLRQPAFLHCLQGPSKNVGMKPTSWNSIPRVFFCFVPMGKLDKTSFQPNWKNFVIPASRYVLGVPAHSPNFLEFIEDFLGKHTFETLEDFLDLSPLIFHEYHPVINIYDKMKY